ncbi:MAG: TolC family protein [Nitrospirota bacterium]|nr:TolC family protein [Nitrospirota bacterium]
MSLTTRILPLLLLFPAVALAEPISLDDYLARVARNHPYAASQALGPDIERQRRAALAGDEDWRLAASPTLYHAEGGALGPFSPEQTDRFSLGLSAGRTSWATGGRLSVGYDYTRSDQHLTALTLPVTGGTGFVDIPTGPERFDQSRVNVGYALPLLKGRGGSLARLPWEAAAFDVQAAELETAENVEAFLAGAGVRYLDWVLATEQHAIAGRRRALAAEELERTERKRRQNLVDTADVLRARAALLAAEQEVIRAQAATRALRTELAVLAGLPADQLEAPDFDLYARAPLPPPGNALRALSESARVLKVFDLREARLARHAEGAREAARPDLDVQVNAALSGSGTGASDALSMNDPAYGVGVSLRYPLGNRSARADLRRVGLERQRLAAARDGAARDLSAALSGITVRLDELERLLTVTAQAVEVARSKTAEEEKLHAQGRTELTFVIQSRDDEQRAQAAHASTAAAWQQLHITWRELTDTLLPMEIPAPEDTP